MRSRLEVLVAALRRAGIAVSVAEAMDAARATAVVDLARPALRDALAATLVKAERDRAAFVLAFDAVFPARVEAVAGARRGRRGAAGGDGVGGGSGATGGSRAVASRGRDDDERVEDARAPLSSAGRPPDDEPTAAPGRSRAAHQADRDRVRGPADAHRDEGSRAECREDAPRADGSNELPPEGRADDGAAAAMLAGSSRERALLRIPFRAMTPADVDASAALARALAARFATRIRRRLRARPTGRLDFRRTIRAAVSHGGVPFERRWRGRRPAPPDLLALCDLSVSTATATDFFLSVLAPATSFFRSVRLFGFVDRLVEIEFAEGQVRPAAPIDLMARSDFGRVLRDLVEGEASGFGADTVVLVLGDARNNRRPPRADLLAAVRARVRRVLWLNPDARERWDTGDSVIGSYARHVDAVVACGTVADLDRALAAVAAL